MTDMLRLGTIPDSHPYLAATLSGAARHVRFAPDDVTGWRPSPLLDPARRRVELVRIDVLHVHFGYEGATAAQLWQLAADVRDAQVGLVVTVHDLRNPHEADRAAHDKRLGALVGAADAVLTLTPGAAAEVSRRWARDATVLPHPTLLALAPTFTPRENRTVGLYLKSLRANVVDPVALARAAVEGARDGGGRLRVDIHERAASASVLAELTDAVGREAQLHVHERLSDDELIDYLAGLDVSILPYRFGTHSGWLELCRDLGVAVVAPDCGHYAEQWPAVQSYVNNERRGFDPLSLRAAVSRALAQPRAAPADRDARLAERERIRAAHGEIYRDATRSGRRRAS